MIIQFLQKRSGLETPPTRMLLTLCQRASGDYSYGKEGAGLVDG